MIYRHVILFTFNDSLSEKEIENVFCKIGLLQEKIPGIISYSWGKNLYESEKNFTHAFMMDFNSKLSREAYQDHPEHIKVVEEYVNPSYLNAIVFDYEILP